MPPVTRSDFPYPLRTIDGRVKLDINGEDITFNTFPANTNLQLDGANNIFGNGQTGSGSNVLQTNPSLVNAYTDKITVTDLDASSSVQTNIVKSLITIPNTGTGGNVLDTAPTINSANLVTPSLGVATATDVTINNLTPNNAVQTDGSSKLVSIANSGSGDNVLRINPQLVNPVLGTASATSINISSLAANSAVQTNGSSTLVTITNEGTGNNILQTSPTLITPDIGVATGTSLETTGNVESDQILVSNRLAGLGLVVNSTTESTSSTTGSARFIGGIGVAKNVYVGGDVNTVATVDCEDLKVNSFDSSSSRITGAIKCNGGIGCNDVYVNVVDIAFSKTNAAIKCQGGIGCDDVWVDSTTSATSKTTAAIKCQGGVGCEDLYVNTTARIPTITSLSTLNTFPFAYSSGQFTPSYTTYSFDTAAPGPLALDPWDSPTGVVEAGEYTRIGPTVSIRVAVSATFDGTNNAYTDSTRYIAIRNLPFRCVEINPTLSVSPIFGNSELVSIPNGRVGGVANFTTPSIDPPFTPFLWPKDYVFTPQGAYPTASLTVDGKTVFYSNYFNSFDIVGATNTSVLTFTNNFHVLSVGTGYYTQFVFNMVYHTDE